MPVKNFVRMVADILQLPNQSKITVFLNDVLQEKKGSLHDLLWADING